MVGGVKIFFDFTISESRTHRIVGSKNELNLMLFISNNPANSTQQNIAGVSKLFSKYNQNILSNIICDVEYARKFSDRNQHAMLISSYFIAIFIACLGCWDYQPL
jgi:hypothetical protein